MVSRARERMGVSLLTTLSSSRCSYYFLINIKCAASNLFFTNPMTLFSMQGPKVKISINSTNSPAVGNSKVVKQGELLNQDSYHPCWVSLLRFPSPSRMLQNPLCCRKRIAIPLLFCNTTSDNEVRDFSNAVIDFSIHSKFLSTAALRELNPCCCWMGEVIPVPAPTAPMPNDVASVTTVIGSLFMMWCVSVSQ